MSRSKKDLQPGERGAVKVLSANITPFAAGTGKGGRPGPSLKNSASRGQSTTVPTQSVPATSLMTDEEQAFTMKRYGRIPPGGWLFLVGAVLIISAALGAGCTSAESKAVAKQNDTVRIFYTATFDDGTIAEPNTSVLLVVGSEPDNLLQQALIGMAPGERKVVNLTGAQAYGPHRPELVREVPRSGALGNVSPKAGDLLMYRTGNVTGVVKVISVTDSTLTIDENHPLAGIDGINVSFNITLVKIV